MLAPTFALLQPGAFSATVQRATPPETPSTRGGADRAPSFAQALAEQDTEPNGRPGSSRPAAEPDTTRTERPDHPDEADSAPPDAREAQPSSADSADPTEPDTEESVDLDEDAAAAVSVVLPESRDADQPAGAIGSSATPEVSPAQTSAKTGATLSESSPGAPLTEVSDPVPDGAPGPVQEASGAQQPPAGGPQAAASEVINSTVPAGQPVQPGAQLSTQPADTKTNRDDAARAESHGHARAGATDPSASDVASARVTAPDAVAASPDAASHQGTGSSRFLDALARAGDTARTASAPREATNPAFGAQVSRGLESALRADSGSVTLRLQPAALGALRIDLRVEGGHVMAQFQASTREAHDLLNAQMTSLRAALEAKGLSVRSVDVQPPTPGAGADGGRNWGSGSQHTGAHGAPFGAQSEAGAGGSHFGGREDPGRFHAQDAHSTPITDADPSAPTHPVLLDGVLDAVA